jgi:hypothetical protein
MELVITLIMKHHSNAPVKATFFMAFTVKTWQTCVRIQQFALTIKVIA